MGTTTTNVKIEDDANYSQMKPPPLREEDLPPDDDDDVVGDADDDDFENGKGTRGTVLLMDKDTDTDENDENEDTLNNKNVSTAYAQKIINRDTNGCT